MTDDAHATTGLLKKASPFWWWVRGNPMQILTLLGMLLAGVGAWHDLKSRVGNIETSVTRLSDKVDRLPQQPEVSGKDFATLRETVAQMRGRWEQVDSVPELKNHRMRGR